MFFSKLNAMSIGTMWVLRSREESQFARPHSDYAKVGYCSVCGGPWIECNVETRSVVVVFPSPITNEAEQKLFENCLTAAGWNAHSACFSLHAPCSSDSQPALLALQEHIAMYSPELIIVFGSEPAQLMHPDFVSGQAHQFANTRLIVTHHPEEMISNPALKAQVWADLCLAKMK